jgi:hypothetical protein
MTWDNDKLSGFRELISSGEADGSGGRGRRAGFWIRLILVPGVVLAGFWLVHSWGVV